MQRKEIKFAFENRRQFDFFELESGDFEFGNSTMISSSLPAVETPTKSDFEMPDPDQFAAWAERNDFWAGKGQSKRWRGRRERNRDPLILCGHGVSINVDRGTLAIRDGLTHYPQERMTYRFFKDALDLPPKIVMLDGTGSISFDVLAWLSEQNIPLIRLDYRGTVVSVIGGAGFTMDPQKVQWQIDTRNDPMRRLEFSCNLISAKLTTSLETLNQVVPDSAARQVAIASAEAALSRLRAGSVRSVDELRMVEAAAAARYFSAWSGLPLAWRSKWKYPVRDTWLTIGSRGSHGRGRAISNRNAKHPVNAILNYAYGMLNSQVHIEAVAAGYDPRRGVMHHDRDDGDAFAWVFDMVEPRRAIVDAAVLKFVLSTPFTGADFVVRNDGVCRLAPQLSKRIAQLA